MKILFFVSAVLLMCGLPNISQAGYTKKQIENFMIKNNFCQIAWGFESNDSTAGEKRYNGRMFLCVGDMTLNVGTIKELSGCAFGIYNAENSALMSPYHRREDPAKLHNSGFPIVEGNKCNTGGFDKLKNLYPGLFYGKTVEQALTRGMDVDCQLGGACDVNFAAPELVYSQAQEIEKWWEDRSKKAVPSKVKTQAPSTNCNTFAVTMQDKWQCLSMKDLEKEVCDWKNSGDAQITKEVKAAYRARFGKKMVSNCNNPN